MLNVAVPAGWDANRTLETVKVGPQSKVNLSLAVNVPASAAADRSYPVAMSIDDGFTEPVTVNATVRVVPRPVVEGSQALPAPRLSLAVSTGDTGAAETTVTGLLTIYNNDQTRPNVPVTITLLPSGGWDAYADAPTFRRLGPGDSTTFTLRAKVPALAQNASQTFTIRIDADGHPFSTTWTVHGVAAAPAATETAPPTPPTTSGGATPTRGPGGPSLSFLVQPLELSVPSGGEATGTVVLENIGGVPLRLELKGTPPTQWAPVVFDPSVVDLAPGATARATFTLRAPRDLPPGGTASALIQAVGDGLQRSDTVDLVITPSLVPRDDSTASAATIRAPETPDGALPETGFPVAITVGLAAVGAGALALANRPLREKLLWGAAGLYTRLARPDVLGHEDREKLYRLVEATPGIHFHALQRDLGWNTGTLTYHLRVLEKHGFMVSRRDGLYRRFYLSGAAPRKEVFENQGPTGLRADVIEAVKNSPGISQSDLALGLGANKQTVNYHVKALERAGTIRVEKRGRDTFLYPATDPHVGPGGPGIARV